MPGEIIVAICSLAGTLIGSLFGVMQASRLTTHRIEQVEKKMDKHNSLIGRMTIAERDLIPMENFNASMAARVFSPCKEQERGVAAPR